MRSGAIGREPNRGKCPEWCSYQPICRLERATAPEEQAAGGESQGQG